MSSTIFQKLSSLPAADRERLSSPQVLGALERLEQQYNLKLVTPYLTYALGEKTLDEVMVDVRASGATEPTQAVVREVFQQLGTQTGAPASAGVNPAASGSVVFSTEDEQEIAQVQSPATQPTANFDGTVQAIIMQAGLGTLDEVMTTRLRNIIAARLRGVRDDIETLEVLEKNPKVGGMEMTAEQAQALVKLIRDQLKQASDTPRPATLPTKLVFPIRKPFVQSRPVSLADRAREMKAAPAAPPPQSPPPAPVPPVTPNPAAARASVSIPRIPLPTVTAGRPPRPGAAPKIGEEDGLPVINMPKSAGPSMAPRPPAPPKPVVEPKIADTILAAASTAVMPASPVPTSPAPTPTPTPVPPPATVPLPPPLPRPARVSTPIKPTTSVKPTLDGVRAVAQPMGPIDELQNMTLIEFRRLGDARQAMSQIIEKIALLEQESYVKRLDGIAAWHQSEVCRFYRLLGQESMAQGRPVADIITERQQASKPTLSLDEFDAIMELNSRLRY